MKDPLAQSDILPPHPLEVRPAGNAFINSEIPAIRLNCGIFALLNDDLTLHLLEFLCGRSLLALGSSCKYLYAFTTYDELWKSLFVRRNISTGFSWLGTWRSTYWQFPATDSQPAVSCRGLYSDVLYRPFVCAQTPLARYSCNIPKANQIPKFKDLDEKQFSCHWANKPFILTNPVKKWPIYRDWCVTSLLDSYRHVKFRAEAVEWQLKTYVTYMARNSDESPLYLFDKSFVEKMKLPDSAYWSPKCFGFDLFSLLNEQRPDHRWLIVGPARSGSTFHKDPNGTSAWNAVISGSKYWLMFPSGKNVALPPGIIISDDASEITTPLTIAEYLLSFHHIARATPGCHEGICSAGEVLHVPSGWFHLVLNLEDSIAVTQNFVSENQLPIVLQFLRDLPDQISGFQDNIDAFQLFIDKLADWNPVRTQQALLDIDDGHRPVGKVWSSLTRKDSPNTVSDLSSFAFGFGSMDDEPEEI